MRSRLYNFKGFNRRRRNCSTRRIQFRSSVSYRRRSSSSSRSRSPASPAVTFRSQNSLTGIRKTHWRHRYGKRQPISLYFRYSSGRRSRRTARTGRTGYPTGGYPAGKKARPVSAVEKHLDITTRNNTLGTGQYYPFPATSSA